MYMYFITYMNMVGLAGKKKHQVWNHRDCQFPWVTFWAGLECWGWSELFSSNAASPPGPRSAPPFHSTRLPLSPLIFSVPREGDISSELTAQDQWHESVSLLSRSFSDSRSASLNNPFRRMYQEVEGFPRLGFRRLLPLTLRLNYPIFQGSWPQSYIKSIET